MNQPDKIGSDEDVWRTAARSAGLGVWSVMRGGDISYLSSDWHEMHGTQHGWSARDVWRAWFAQIHPQDRTRIKASLRAARAGLEERMSFEYRKRHPTRGWLHMLCRGAVTAWTPDGVPTAFSGTDTDISDLQAHIVGPTDKLDDYLHSQVAIESANLGVWDVNHETGLRVFSDAWRKLRGYGSDSCYGADRDLWISDIHPADLERILVTDQAVGRQRDDRFNLSYRQRHRNGHWIWILSRGRVITRDADGIPCRLIGIDADITDIKNVEMKKAQLDKTLEVAMSASGVGVWESASDTFHARWDARTSEIFGHEGPHDEIPPSVFKSFIHPADLEIVRLECDVPAAARQDFSSEFRIIHPRKGVRHVQTNAVFHDHPDFGARLVGTVLDVTEDRVKERALVDSKTQMDSVLERMGQGVVLWRGRTLEQASVALCNHQFLDMIELPDHIDTDTMTFGTYLTHIEPFIDWEGQARMDRSKLLEMASRQGTFAMLCQMPSGRVLRTLGMNMPDGGRIVTFTDLTDLFELEAKRTEMAESILHLERLRSLGELTGGIAHDFNNLLAIISGNAEFLKEDAEPENPFVDFILQAAGRGAELTQRLLSFSRKQSLHPTRIDTDALFEDVSGMLKRTLGGQIEVQTHVAPGTWPCTADAGQLESALINLAVNARDAMPQGGQLEMRAENLVAGEGTVPHRVTLPAGDYVRISVIDQGEGMQPEVLSHAFDPFFSTKGSGSGSGLGLSMVYGFAKQSEGDILIDSAPGVGTRIDLYLPRATQDEPVRAPISRNALTMGAGERILVVEDDCDVANMVVKMLERLGYHARAFGDGPAALAVLRADPGTFDLVLSDVTLPGGMNGFEVGAAARAARADLPVVHMSGRTEEVLSQVRPQQHEITLMPKPFTLLELSAIMATALQEAKLPQAQK